MSASELKSLDNNVKDNVATATGFHSALMVMLIFVLVGFVLSLFLRFGKGNAKTHE